MVATTQQRQLGFSAKINRRQLRTLVVFVVLSLLALPFILPFIWMLKTAITPLEESLTYPPQLVPADPTLSNFDEAASTVPLWRYAWNSTFYSVIATFGDLLSSSFVAYGFAKYRARFRNPLFILMLGTMLIPYPVLMVSQYVMFSKIGWVDSYLPLIVPTFFGTPFLIFLFRQFMVGIPDSLIDAARLDGAGPLRIYWTIILPLSVPALMAGGIIAFAYHWNDYLGPLIFLNSEVNFPLQLGLATLTASQGVTRVDLLMAAAVATILPLLVLFFIAQKNLIRGANLLGDSN